MIERKAPEEQTRKKMWSWIPGVVEWDKDPEKSLKRDDLEDVDMSNDDNEEEMEANPNLNQSKILDYFPPRNWFAEIPK